MKVPVQQTIKGLLFKAFSQFHQRPALEIGSKVITYGQLLEMALRWAVKIQDEFSGREKLVAVYADKSLECFAGILGIIFSGRGYVPLNPAFPPARNLKVLDAINQDKLLIGNAGDGFVGELGRLAGKPFRAISGPAPAEGEVRNHGTDAGTTVYLLFTSGSTGEPKGVPVSESNLVAYVANAMGLTGIGPDDRCSQTFDLTFDLSVHDLFVTWCSGACLVVPENPSPLQYYRYIKEKMITCWFSVPSVAMMMDRMRLLRRASLPELRISLFCGEPLHTALARKWKDAATGSELYNLYGPTEGTIAISSFRLENGGDAVERDGILSIGAPFPGQYFGIGENGELLLSGSQVVSGYFNDPGTTSEKFFTGDDGRKWYRTGDRAEMAENGLFYYRGRLDSEIKLRGYRINLLELDHTLESLPEINQAISLPDNPGFPEKIISFLVAEGEKPIDAGEIINHCKLRLPWYMVPETVIFVGDFPLNVNGKIDRNRLMEQWNERKGD